MINIEEIWIDIIGYEDYYQISNLGRVRSKDRYIIQEKGNGTLYKRHMKGKILSLNRTNGKGYKTVSLGKGCEESRQNFYVHRLVAEHFISNPNNLPEINHKDKKGDKSNNCVDNLEWCTRKENMEHAFENNLNQWVIYKKNGIRKGKDNYNTKLTETEVIEIYNLLKENKLSCREIGELYNVSKQTILAILHKKTWKDVLDKLPLLNRKNIKN